jgi:hypothetical protein
LLKQGGKWARQRYFFAANSLAAAAAKEKSKIVADARSALTPAVATSMAIQALLCSSVGMPLRE